MAREYSVTIKSDLSGDTIEDEAQAVQVEVRFPDGRRMIGEVTPGEGTTLANGFREVKKRAARRARNPDGSFVSTS